MIKNLLLAVILLLAIVLRFFWSGVVPPSLNWDEASLGYNAYSIFKTGKDEWGKSFPLTFEAFGDFKLPGYIYSSIPFIYFFGLSDFGVRFLSQLFGVFSVLFLYLIIKELTKEKTHALIGAFLLAVSPWHVFLSRIALEANYAFGLFLIGFYFFLLGLRKNSFLILSSVFFGLTIFTYNSARVFMPLFIVALVLIYRKELISLKKNLLIPSLILLLFILSAGALAIFQDSSSRYFWLTLLDQGAINSINEARANSSLPGVLPLLINNKVVYFLQSFLLNYFNHFNPDFLFIRGGTNYQFSVPNFGLLYIIELPLTLLGLWQVLKKKKIGLVLLAWLLISPIPSAITRDSPHPLRAIFMLGSLQAITAFGIYYLWRNLAQAKLYRYSVGLILAAGFLYGSVTFFSNYFISYPKHYSKAWQDGYKEVYSLNEFNTYLASGKKIFITKKYGEPHIFYLFYKTYDPENYQNNPNLIRYAKSNWRWVDRLDNLFFLNDWEVKEKTATEKDALLITSPKNYPEKSKVLETIYFLDGSVAFDVVQL